MKFIIFILQALLIPSIAVHAQNDVTQFLGIPVDGSKTEMIQKLKAKGFHTNSYDKDVLEGEFNGKNVYVRIATNNDKVCRIMVSDINSVDERSIQIRFNNLCRQFEQNPKYISLGNYQIPDDENIDYEITVKNKRYEAIFYQLPTELSDTTLLREKLKAIISKKYTVEDLANPTKEIQKDVMMTSFEYMINSCSKKPVWFMISDFYGEYYITMFYDNEYNRANGEDL